MFDRNSVAPVQGDRLIEVARERGIKLNRNRLLRDVQDAADGGAWTSVSTAGALVAIRRLRRPACRLAQLVAYQFVASDPDRSVGRVRHVHLAGLSGLPELGGIHGFGDHEDLWGTAAIKGGTPD